MDEDVKKEEVEMIEEPVEAPMEDEEPIEEASEDAEGEIPDEMLDEEGKFPFPMAAVVRRIKAKSSGQMISSKVKIATNNFLGYIADRAAEEMATTRYSTIEMDDFQRATQPFFAAQELEAEKERVIKHLEKMRSDIEMLIREFEQKFGMENVERKFI